MRSAHWYGQILVPKINNSWNFTSIQGVKMTYIIQRIKFFIGFSPMSETISSIKAILAIVCCRKNDNQFYIADHQEWNERTQWERNILDSSQITTVQASTTALKHRSTSSTKAVILSSMSRKQRSHSSAWYSSSRLKDEAVEMINVLKEFLVTEPHLLFSLWIWQGHPIPNPPSCNINGGWMSKHHLGHDVVSPRSHISGSRSVQDPCLP